MQRTIPMVTQYASPNLVNNITYHHHPRTHDPRWPETGAPNLAAYAAWSVRWCGMACLRMVLLARDGAAPTLYELAHDAMAYGAYSDAAGAPGGLIYAPFVEYVQREHALGAAVVVELTTARLRAELAGGNLVMASVHPEIRRPKTQPTTRGGHLVLVTGYREIGDALTFHDPAGHTAGARVATMPSAVFDRFAAHRGVVFHDPGSRCV